MNGRGTPTTGRMPATMPIFMAACQKNMLVMPKARRKPNLSFASVGGMSAYHQTSVKSVNQDERGLRGPTPPAYTENMKSVWCSGRNMEFALRACGKPLTRQSA